MCVNCLVVVRDILTYPPSICAAGDPKLKLYRDVNGEMKGDGLCCYLKVHVYALSLRAQYLSLLIRAPIYSLVWCVHRSSQCLWHFSYWMGWS